VTADIFPACVAATIPKEPRHGFHRADFEPVTEDIPGHARPTSSIPVFIPQHCRLPHRCQIRTSGEPGCSDARRHARPLLPAYDPDDIDEVPGAEAEAAEEQILDQATAAQTLAELEAEIAILKDLEDRALRGFSGGSQGKGIYTIDTLTRVGRRLCFHHASRA
jgi:hypothetical protein